VPFTRIPFPTLPFTQGGHPLERKKTGAHPSVTLLEFASGFADRNWCRRAHIVYVLQGRLTFEFESETESFAVGESCVIDAGTPHRARNDGQDTVQALVVSDVIAAPIAAEVR
jgi:quercetin dioxygenase-like cupin family protein